ncbi:MAG: class II aldolase/adducin family protein [Dehalococcoidia bacterium]|nr:class II aldolase/adducin family protein [Dehalococcoidia bacterium]
MNNLANYRHEIVEAADQIARSGIMTKSLHGNLSQRVPNTDTFLLTAGGSLASMKPENIALFDLGGNLLEGTVMPVGAEIIQMHAVVYRTRPEFTGVVHTHSPFATGFACAGQAIPAAYEALVRIGAIDGVPVALYGPRGSEQSANNIAAVLKAHQAISSLLLENHGVLAFGEGVSGAVRANMVAEEAAEILLYSASLGGAKKILAQMIQATRERAASFAAAGSYSSEPAQAD